MDTEERGLCRRGFFFRQDKVRTPISDDFQLNHGQSVLDHAQLHRCRLGEIEDSTIHIGATIIDPNADMLPVGQIHHPHHAAERESPVGGGHGLHVKQLPVGGLFAMKLLPVPGGNAPVLDPDIQPRFPLRHP